MRCSRSISDSSRLVKNLITPLTGGASAIGLVVSMTTLPASVSGPASRTTFSAAVPFTASTTMSPNRAASWTAPTLAREPAFAAHSLSLPASRLPTIVSKPCFTKPLASV
jgi:hypothetical protein